MYSLRESNISFEDMFIEIGERNRIKTYNFIIYCPLRSYDRMLLFSEGIEEARKELEATIYAEMPVPPEHFRSKSRADIENEMAVRDFYQKTLGISSIVNINDSPSEKFHIKQMDFSCEPTEESAELVAGELAKMKTGGGWLVNSGDSFHFYGKFVVASEGWLKYMKNFDLIATDLETPTTIDRDYPLMNITRGYSVLRVMESKLKVEPQIVFDIKE